MTDEVIPNQKELVIRYFFRNFHDRAKSEFNYIVIIDGDISPGFV